MAKSLHMVLLALVAAAVPATLATSNLCPVPGNYFITYDVSGSVDAGEFATEQTFVKNLVIATNIAGSKFFINVFDDDAYTPPVADTFANPAQDVVASVTNYARPGSGSTGIGNAIVSLVTRAGQLGVTKGVLVILTDGQNNTGVSSITAGNSARAAGLTVVAVGIGNQVSTAELQAVAGVNAANNPGIYIPISSGFSTLPAALDSVIKAACPAATCISTCTGRTAPQADCPVTNSWTPCKSCTTNSLVLDYPGASSTCTRCLAAGPDGLDRCFWCVTNALTLKTGKTALCSCCDKVYNCYNTLENALVNQKGWEQYVLRCKEKFTASADQDKCFWCLTNALTTDPKTCTGDTLNFCAA